MDEALARKLWPADDALGQRIQIARGDRGAEGPDSYEVVGIVKAVRRELFEKELPGAIYVPFGPHALGNAWFHVRPAAGSIELTDLVRREIRDAAPGLPVFTAHTFESHIESSIEYWALRVSAALFGFFGVMATLVALVGIYGVMSYSVARRTREIGIRIAVGAMPAAVRRLILDESLSLTLLGVGLGWVLGLGVGRVLGSIFVDLSAFDPLTFAVVPVAFVTAALIAAWVPARRATKVNPMAALRSE